MAQLIIRLIYPSNETLAGMDFALATIIAMGLFAVVTHAPVMVALPIATALGFSAGLFSTPLILAPLLPAPLVSAIMPRALVPASIVMGKQGRWLFAGNTGQARPRITGSLDGRLDDCHLRCASVGRCVHLCCRCRTHCRESEQGQEYSSRVMEFHGRRQPLVVNWTCGHLVAELHDVAHP